MSLPPLFPEFARFAPTQSSHYALKHMVQAYGQACRDAGLEEAAIEAERNGHLCSGAPSRALFNLAEQIRSLK